MIDHMNLPVSNLTISKAFYDTILASLDYICIAEDGPAIGYGTHSWNFGIEFFDCDFPKLHVAFSANSEKQVDDFFSAALTAGATSNGDPGKRPQYGSNYYAAFIKDPDGHNIEAVFRG